MAHRDATLGCYPDALTVDPTNCVDSNAPMSIQSTVTVVGAVGQSAALDSAVQDVGPDTGLADTVSAAETYLVAGDTPRACTTLQAFLMQVKALTGKKIPLPTAQPLTADAGSCGERPARRDRGQGRGTRRRHRGRFGRIPTRYEDCPFVQMTTRASDPGTSAHGHAPAPVVKVGPIR